MRWSKVRSKWDEIWDVKGMKRLVVPLPPADRATGASADQKGDKLLARMIKYIPSEVIAGYLFIIGIVEGVVGDDFLKIFFAWVILGFGALMTYIYLNVVGQEEPTKKKNLAISIVSFLLWAYALSRSSKCLSHYCEFN